MTPLDDLVRLDTKKRIDAIIVPTISDSERTLLHDELDKLLLLEELLIHWQGKRLRDFRILTERRLNRDIQTADWMRREHDNQEYWQRKHDNLLLLRKLLNAWQDDSIALTQFKVAV